MSCHCCPCDHSGTIRQYFSNINLWTNSKVSQLDRQSDESAGYHCDGEGCVIKEQRCCPWCWNPLLFQPLYMLAPFFFSLLFFPFFEKKRRKLLLFPCPLRLSKITWWIWTPAVSTPQQMRWTLRIDTSPQQRRAGITPCSNTSPAGAESLLSLANWMGKVEHLLCSRDPSQAWKR